MLVSYVYAKPFQVPVVLSVNVWVLPSKKKKDEACAPIFSESVKSKIKAFFKEINQIQNYLETVTNNIHNMYMFNLKFF